MILNKFLLFFCFCLLLSHSLAKKLSKAKAEKLLSQALEDGEQYEGELRQLGRRYEEMNEQIDDVLRKQNEYNNLVAAGLSAEKAEKQLKEAAKELKKNPTINNWQRFNEAKEDLENAVGGVAEAVVKKNELQLKVAKLTAERQAIVTMLIGIKLEEEAAEKRSREAYREFQKEERQEKREERQEKREERKRLRKERKEKKKKDAQTKFTESLVGGLVGGGAGLTIGTIGGNSILSIIRSRLAKAADQEVVPVGEQHPLGDVAL